MTAKYLYEGLICQYNCQHFLLSTSCVISRMLAYRMEEIWKNEFQKSIHITRQIVLSVRDRYTCIIVV